MVSAVHDFGCKWVEAEAGGKHFSSRWVNTFGETSVLRFSRQRDECVSKSFELFLPQNRDLGGSTYNRQVASLLRTLLSHMKNIKGEIRCPKTGCELENKTAVHKVNDS